MVAGKRSFQFAFIFRNAPAFFVGNGMAAAITVGVEVDRAAFRYPGETGDGPFLHSEFELCAFTRSENDTNLVLPFGVGSRRQGRFFCFWLSFRFRNCSYLGDRLSGL